MDVRDILENKTSGMIVKAQDLGKALMLADYDHIFMVGFGSSGFVIEMLQSLVRAPIIHLKGYTLPSYATSRSVLVCVSYSGNTEEVITVYDQAQLKGCKLMGITSGGRLRDQLFRDNHRCIRVPSDVLPRVALPFMLFPLLNMFSRTGLCEDYSKSINSILERVKHPKLKYSAEQLANSIGTKIPLIYATDRLMPVAKRWKMQINEMAKQHAFCEQLPSMNHFEIEAFKNKREDMHVILLLDEEEYIRNRLRFEKTKQIITSQGYTVTELAIRGSGKFMRMYSAIYMGDLVSVYLAGILEQNPNKTTFIDSIKKEL